MPVTSRKENLPQNERVWVYRYNLNDQLIYLKNPEKNRYRYKFDALGNLVSVKENNTLTTRYHYNPLSWKLREENVPANQKETFTYHPTGKVQTYRDKAGNRREYRYTPFYDVDTVTVRNSSNRLLNTQTYEYFPNTSLVKRQVDSNGSSTTGSALRESSYTYDSFQRVNSFTAFQRLYQIGYTNKDDLMDQLTYFNGPTVTYDYDGVDRLTQVSSSEMGTVTYDYKVGTNGEIQTITYPNTTKMELGLDSFAHIRSMKHDKSNAVHSTESNAYTFDNISSTIRDGKTYTYRYDKVDRIKSEGIAGVSTSQKKYTYDTRGNRNTFSGQMASFAGNQMYTFDSLNRLQTYSNGTDTVSYKYYADGLRASKDEGGQKTNYVYLNGKVIEEIGASGNVLAQTIWGNKPLFRKDFTTNKTGYYLYNSHGDVTEITDTKGNTLNSYEYDSWGNILSQTQEMSNPFTYAGEMYDKETGNYYLRARYYDPTVGRFISEDTNKGQVDNPLSLNRYTYGHNNPIRFTDPSGHVAQGDAGGNWSGEETIHFWVSHVQEKLKSGAVHADAYAQVPNDVRNEVEFRVLHSDNDMLMLGLGGRGGGGFVANSTKQASGSTLKYTITNTAKTWRATGFALGKLDSHFQKHVVKKQEWADLGISLTKDGYFNRASNLLNSKVGGDIAGFTSKNGYVFRYNNKTNEFATAKPDGTIETLFRPKDGKNYWNEQVELYGGN